MWDGEAFGGRLSKAFFALKTEVLICVCLCFEDWKTSCCSLGLG